jgi:vacuolar-type H+-ATPase subunit C/Vma6
MAVQSVTDYSLVHATVRALYSAMLTPDEWGALVQAQDFDTLANVLSETAYGSYLILKDLTPRRAVYQVRRHLVALYEKVIRLTPESSRQLLLWMWRLYEVDNLKATLRGIETGASWSQVLYLLYPMRRHTALTVADMERMVRSGSIARAVELIRHTPYYETLAHALERYEEEKSLFPLEVALDLDYGRGLWQSISQLSGVDYEQGQRIVGSMLDMNNLLWAIRYRVYHHLSEQEIINYTLPVGYQVHDRDIRAIAAGAGIGQTVRGIYKDIKEADNISEQTGEGLGALEAALQRRLTAVCRATFIGYPFHIGVPAAFLVLNEYEIRDLTVLIEAKASRLPVEAFASMLVMQPQPSAR